MANTKISQLTVATTLDSNTQNTLLIIVDKSSGTPVTKQVELQKIDTVLDYTVDKANSAALYANGAFIKANAAFNAVNTGAISAGTYANAAFIVANSAYDSQNATGSYANSAFIVANTPSNVANSGSLYANGAFVQANAAYNSQNTTGSYANSGLTKANAAYALANLNYLQAATRLNVSYTGTTAYLFDQYIGNNPTLHFLPGQTVAFDLNYVDNHPFAIRITAGGINVSTRLVHVSPTGVVSFNDEAQGKNSGVLYWKVPNDLMNEQYAYQCLNHPGSMVGTIRLEPNGSVVQNIANAAFITANTPSHVANSASLYANAAFNQANGALAIATYIANSGVNVATNLSLTGNIIPTSTLTSNLGDANTRFHTLFVGPGSIDIDGFVLSNSAIPGLLSIYNPLMDGANGVMQPISVGGIYLHRTYDPSIVDIGPITSTYNSNTGNYDLLISGADKIQMSTGFDWYTHMNAAFAAANSAVAGTTDTYARGHANLSFTQANAAFIHANAAFAQANSGGGGTDTYARNTANAAFTHANSAFSKANNALATVSNTAPSNPVEGQFWFDAANSSLKIYATNVWIQLTTT